MIEFLDWGRVRIKIRIRIRVRVRVGVTLNVQAFIEGAIEEFHRKTRYIHCGQFEIYLRFKLLKYKEDNKKICNTFDHNFKNIPLYMSNVSLERYYFVLYDGALTLKMSKWCLMRFAIKLFNCHLSKCCTSILSLDVKFRVANDMVW